MDNRIFRDTWTVTRTSASIKKRQPKGFRPQSVFCEFEFFVHLRFQRNQCYQSNRRQNVYLLPSSSRNWRIRVQKILLSSARSWETRQMVILSRPLAGLQIRLEFFLERFAAAMDERFRGALQTCKFNSRIKVCFNSLNSSGVSTPSFASNRASETGWTC